MELEVGEAKWLGILEKEFDKECRSMQLRLKSEEMKTKKDLLPFESGLSALTGLFTQLVLKTKTLLQMNNSLKTILENTQAKLTRVLTGCGRLQRELQARRLEVRSLEVQLSKEPDKEKELCALRTELELELERYNQGDAREEQLNAELSVTRQLNLSLVGCVSLLQSDLAGVSLIANCTESELNGRIQQLQLLLSGVHGPDLQKLWTQILAEITVHKQKSILRAYYSRPKSVLSDPYKFLGEAHKMRVSELKQVLLGCSPNTAAGDTLVLGKRRTVRTVTLTRSAGEQLGISIVGGAELGVPILISGLEEDKVACTCGELQIGDAILSVNGDSLQGRTHEDVVALVGTKETVVTLEVMFAIGVLEVVPRREKGNGHRSASENVQSHPHQLIDESSAAQIAVEGKPERQSTSSPGPSSVAAVVHTDVKCLQSEETAVVQSSASQKDLVDNAQKDIVDNAQKDIVDNAQKDIVDNTQQDVVDNAQKLSCAFALEHSSLGFVPKDLDTFSLESTLFCYDQDPALHMGPAAVIGGGAVNSRGSEAKPQSHDYASQINTPSSSCLQPRTSPLCPTTPLYQTTILSIQSLNSTDINSDAPLFSLTL